MSARDRMADDHFDVFEATAKGILRWVETTRETGGRRPSRESVVAHVSRLRDEGLISERDLAALAVAGYRV